MVRIEEVGRTAASALPLDEHGEVVRPVPRPATPARRRAPRKPRSAPKPVPVELAVQEPSANGASEGPQPPAEAEGASEGSQPPLAEAEGEDGVQSKPRRRGRRGGRRRSAAKAETTSE